MCDIFKKFFEALANWIGKCLPVYEPSEWNDNNGIQHDNNCYNYACNIKNNSYAQPGYASGIFLNLSDYYCSGSSGAVWNAAMADGLVPSEEGKGCGCSKCWHKVALAMNPGGDFHWFRLDRDGMWSHKPGTGQATNLDSSSIPISDPATANRGNYTDFCGYFCVCKSDITLAGPLVNNKRKTMNKDRKGMKVILQIFSGRPDPEWELDENLAEIILQRLHTSRKSGKPEEVPNMAILGYRGFRVVTDGSNKSIPGQFTVFKGSIVTTERTELRAIADTEALEQMLLEDARKHGFGELLDNEFNASDQ